ncbi:MAG: hypothetical protein AB1716_15830 [Planctomycetota bacterium]
MKASRRLAGLSWVGALALTAAAQNRIHFALYKYNDGRLQSMNRDGSDVRDLFTAGVYPPADWLPVGLEVDAGKIYWTHGSTPGLIRRANLDGSAQELVASNLKIPRGAAIDPVGGKIYWSAAPPEGNAAGLILRRNLDGSGATEEVYRVTPYDPVGSKVGRPTVDAANGYVYFGTNGAVKRVNLDGPPFVVHTVATGGSTITRVQLDTASNCLYWIDSDTISDCVVRVALDDSDFAVVLDSTPGVFGSSGLSDLALDLAGGKLYLADEIRDDGAKVIERCELAGANLETIYSAPAGFACVAFTFDTTPPQPMQDCNRNGIRDKDDIASGFSQDCNNNGIPDECEVDPCIPPNWLLNQGLDPNQAGRLVGNGYEVFQPFDVPAGGWSVGELQLNGWTNAFDPAGFTATVFPDNGGNYPDEARPLGSGSAYCRYSQSWVRIPLAVSLPAGRHWVGLTANAAYQGNIYVGTTGLLSFSRRNTQHYYGRPPLALRLLAPRTRPGDLNCDRQVNFDDINPFVLVLSDPQAWQQQYPNCPLLNGDCNRDGRVNFDDINPFVALLSGP